MTGLLSPTLSNLDLEKYMRTALEEADAAGKEGELPIGAVVVIDGEIIARGHARHNATRCQLRHAELNALLAGGEPLWSGYRRAILFTTVEPCPLCLGAAVMADVPHIIYALPDNGVYSAASLEHNPYIHRHIQSYYGGILEAESRDLLRRYQPKVLAYIERGGKTPA